MRTERQPYEVLFRWSDRGALQGAHVKWLYVTYDDAGAIITAAEGAPEYIAVAGHHGYPLAEIMELVTQTALADREAKHAEAATAAAERDAALKAKIAAEAAAELARVQMDALRARLETASAQLAEANEANRRGVALQAEITAQGT